jgi:hypothetical protein
MITKQQYNTIFIDMQSFPLAKSKPIPDKQLSTVWLIIILKNIFLLTHNNYKQDKY